MSAEKVARPKVLVLTPRYPYPVIGGDRLRIYEICKKLAARCSLTLISLCESRDEMEAAIPQDGVFDRIERVFLPPWRSRFNVLLTLPTRVPLQVAYYRSQEFARRVNEEVSSHDVCLAHLIRTGEYLRGISAPKVLEMTDAISLNYQRVKQTAGSKGWKSQVYRIEADRLAAYEREVLREFDAVSLVSAVDRDFLLDGYINERVMVVSNGVDLERFPFRDAEVNNRVIAFIGNMFSAQNLDAVWYFAEKVLPELRLQGDFIFRVVGRIRDNDAKSLQRIAGVELRSNVPDVANAVGDAFAAVAPIRLGAGVQNKVLEYMSLGIPSVVSYLAFEGLEAEPEKDLLIAAEPNEYVRRLLQLAQEPELRMRLAIAGRKYVEQHHSWQARLAPLSEQIYRLAGQASGFKPTEKASNEGITTNL